ncbi:MAG: SH3 domain-containing protein, partial [Chloroflexota bacterium]|nr:SH3 domain-containing protein [Chloroflexota bacterium]
WRTDGFFYLMEVTVFETKALYQNDQKWKNVKLGHDKKETIGTWGCLLTSMTMVANGFGFDETPESLNRKLKNAGGFQGALVIPATLPSVCPGIVYKSYQPCENNPAPIGQIDAALAAGMPVIAQVDWSPKAGLQTHWLLLYGKEGDRYLMKDPYRYSGDAPDKKLYLTDRYKHSGKNPARAITGVVWFQGRPKSGASAAATTPAAKPEKVPVPTNTFNVFGTADGLAFRASASISGALLGRLPLHVELTSLEANAKNKIGVVNEWLHVQSPDGDQGYVAAWYLTTNKEKEKQKAAAPKTGDKGLVVRPTTTGLAFRTTPQVADHTLIKRLPGGASLVVQEPIASAKKKIGVRGKWLKVKDVTGKVGYVAAWYVTASGEPALGVKRQQKSAKPTDDDDVVLRTTTDNVALRKQPQVAANTLIKRMHNAAELLILDDADEDNIGTYGKWIRVRDIEEDEGYVAAWYVIKR